MTYPDNIPPEQATMFSHPWVYDLSHWRAVERAREALCLCPGDCNCRHQNAPWHRFNYCGCKAHNVEER